MDYFCKFDLLWKDIFWGLEWISNELWFGNAVLTEYTKEAKPRENLTSRWGYLLSASIDKWEYEFYCGVTVPPLSDK